MLGERVLNQKIIKKSKLGYFKSTHSIILHRIFLVHVICLSVAVDDAVLYQKSPGSGSELR